MINNTLYSTGGKVQNPLAPPANLTAKAGNAQVTLTWTDPPNTTVSPSGQTLAEWSYTRVIRKAGSQPTGPHDGELVVSSSVRDQYASTGFVDTGLQNDTLYCYAAYAYNTDGVASSGAFTSATPIAGTPLSQLAEGTLIKINENGSPVEFYLAKHNYQSDLNGNGKTLVLRKNIYDKRSWNSTDSNEWSSCTLHSWLNQGYKALFSSQVQSLMGITQYYYTTGYSQYQLTTRADSVFLLSATEYGYPAYQFNEEGIALPISQIIKKDGVSKWTRTPITYGSGNVVSAYYNDTARGLGVNTNDGLIGNCPCFTLPATALVDQDLNLIES